MNIVTQDNFSIVSPPRTGLGKTCAAICPCFRKTPLDRNPVSVETRPVLPDEEDPTVEVVLGEAILGFTRNDHLRSKCSLNSKICVILVWSLVITAISGLALFVLYLVKKPEDEQVVDFCSLPDAIDYSGPFNECIVDGKGKKVADAHWVHFHDHLYEGEGWWPCRLTVKPVDKDCARRYSSTCYHEGRDLPVQVASDMGMSSLYLADC